MITDVVDRGRLRPVLLPTTVACPGARLCWLPWLTLERKTSIPLSSCFGVLVVGGVVA
jgi:hypothetical protein